MALIWYLMLAQGIRVLGDEICARRQPLYLFLSHYHWDHIQGFPFFRPAYQSQQDIFFVI